MRRTYISPEFKYTKKPGTNSMQEIKFPFGSKMIEIEDTININDSSIIWYEKETGEQLNLNSELTSSPKILNLEDLKLNSHQIKSIDNRNKWKIEIDLFKIIDSYIFASIKNARTFEGITNEDVINGDIDNNIYDYIRLNILSRYRFDDVIFWLKWNKLTEENKLKLKNNFNKNSKTNLNLYTKIETIVENNKLIITLDQEKDFNEFNFDYYFDLKFSKI